MTPEPVQNEPKTDPHTVVFQIWSEIPTVAPGSHVVVQLGAFDVAGDAVVEAVVVVVDVKVGQVSAQASRLVRDPVRFCRVVPQVWWLVIQRREVVGRGEWHPLVTGHALRSYRSRLCFDGRYGIFVHVNVS